MEAEKYIEIKVDMLKNGYSHAQVRNDIFRHVFKEYMPNLTIDAMIDKCMELYAEVVKRAEQTQSLVKNLTVPDVIGSSCTNFTITDDNGKVIDFKCSKTDIKHCDCDLEKIVLNSVVTCFCGLVIPDSEIEYSNRCNDEGEEYYEGTADCTCGKEYEWSEWGECDSLTEAKEDLIEYISNCK